MSNMSPREKRERLFKKQSGNCHYCGKSMHQLSNKVARKRNCLGTKATLEHIIPRAYGGTHGFTNLVCACHDCNNQRGKMDYHLFLRLRKSLFFREELRKYNQDVSFRLEMLDRIRPMRAYVYA